jgi:hypothetical protein
MLLSRTVACRGIGQAGRGQRIVGGNVNRLQQAAAQRGLDNHRIIALTEHEQRSTIGVEFNTLRIDYAVLRHIKVGYQAASDRELIDFSIGPVHHEQLVVPGVVGNPLRITTPASQGIKACPGVISRANQPVGPRIEIPDLVLVIV